MDTMEIRDAKALLRSFRDKMQAYFEDLHELPSDIEMEEMINQTISDTLMPSRLIGVKKVA